MTLLPALSLGKLWAPLQDTAEIAYRVRNSGQFELGSMQQQLLNTAGQTRAGIGQLSRPESGAYFSQFFQHPWKFRGFVVDPAQNVDIESEGRGSRDQASHVRPCPAV